MTGFTDTDIEAILDMLGPSQDRCTAPESSNSVAALDESGRVTPRVVPFCDEHWEDWCEWLESEAAVLGGLTAHPVNWW